MRGEGHLLNIFHHCFLPVDHKEQTFLGQRQEKEIRGRVLIWEASLCSTARACYLFDIMHKSAKTQPRF